MLHKVGIASIPSVLEYEPKDVHSHRLWTKVSARTTLEKKLIISQVFFCLLATFLVTCITTFAVKNSELSKKLTEKENVCTSVTCLERSLWIRNAINYTSDPCENFYEYACGNWISQTEIPSDKSWISSFDGIQDSINRKLKSTLLSWSVDQSDVNSNAVNKAAFAYQKCVYSDSSSSENEIFATLAKIIKSVGGCSLLTPFWNAKNLQKSLFLAQVQSFAMRAILTVTVQVDVKDSETHRLTVMQPVLALPDKNHYLNQEAEPFLTYRKFALDVFYELGKVYGTVKENASYEKEVDEMLALERTIAEVTFEPESLRDETETYSLVKLCELPPLFRAVIENLEFRLLNQTMDVDEEIQLLLGHGFLDKYHQILSSATNRVVGNYGIWYLIQSLFLALPERIRDMGIPLENTLSGSDPYSRPIACMHTFDQYFSFAIGRLFIDRFFDKSINKDIDTLADFIFEEFRRSSLEHGDWIDEETKAKAMEKLDNMGREIAHPEFLLNDTALNELYADIVLPGGNSTLMEIIRNVLLGTAKSTLKQWTKRLRAGRRAVWPIGPHIVNAFYSQTLNAIYFPGAILNPPFYHHDLPKAMNFGGIGYVIGHEITHGFDDTGRKYDKSGKMADWWTNGSIEAFESRAQCVVQQYSASCYDKFATPSCVNGNLTQGENIADMAALRTAYTAYQNWKHERLRDEKLPGLQFSDEQLFFLTTAHLWCFKQTDQHLSIQLRTDYHSPLPYRVNVVMQNIEHFADTWQCKKGSTMNPERRCRVW